MDGRILINHNASLTYAADVPELHGWIPDAPAVHRDGAVHEIGQVSVIVPTFFNEELKRRSLRYLLTGIEQARCVTEVILVASDGENVAFNDLASCTGDLPIRVVTSPPHNRGKSRNAGAEAARSEWLLFLDDDMLLRSWRSIDVLISRLIKFGYDAALFPRRHYVKFPLLFDPPLLMKTIEEWRESLSDAKSPFLYDPLRDGVRDLPMQFCFPGCFMLIRKDSFQRVKGFTDEFVGWGFEDTEFGQRAIRELHVMNLFRQAEPLLHVDHPVSPYKSDEHSANFQKFYSAPRSVDVNLFCRAVFRGEDFSPTTESATEHCRFVDPFRSLASRGIPLDAAAMEPWCVGVAQQRLRHQLSPLPKFIVLHGSRARGSDEWDDDYDVLSLYYGAVRDFYVSPGAVRVEVECANVYHLEHIAAHPAMHSFQGAMELAKIAQARLLWGDAAEWKAWSSSVLQMAMQSGWCFWLVLGLGMRLQAAKYGSFVERYFDCVKKLANSAEPLNRTLPIDFSDRSILSACCRESLEANCPEWREKIKTGEPIFEVQPPEIWIALQRLANTTAAAGPLGARPRPAHPNGKKVKLQSGGL